MPPSSIPQPPASAPQWFAQALTSIVRWVLGLQNAPVPLVGYAFTSLPTLSGNKRSLAFDSTNQVPAFINDTGAWTDLISTSTVLSGTYTPTLTAVANVGASSANACQYMRVAKVVTVSGILNVTPSIISTPTTLGISLPIASTLSASYKCAGTAESPAIASNSGAITGDTSNNRAQLQFVSLGTGSEAFSFIFTYLIT